MKKLLLSLFIGIVFLHLSCSRDKELSNDVEAQSQVQIRIRNASLLPFEDIEVNTSGGINKFGTVGDNEMSDYKTFDFAYRYSFVKLNINGEPYIIQPIDYTGEHKLESGKYTYEIRLDPESNQIFMSLANE